MNRLDYVKYDEGAYKVQEYFKLRFNEIIVILEEMGASRSQSLALTKLEEAYMWIGKAIRDDQLRRNGKIELQEERKNG